MNVGANLTAEEFKNVHNALYHIRVVREDLIRAYGEKGAAEFVKELEKQENIIRAQFASAYAEDERIFVNRGNYYEEFRRKNNLQTAWRMFEVADLTKQHPYKGVGILLYKNHWGPDTITVDIEGDTYADLYFAADKAIRASEDLHHMFIEGFEYNDEEGLLILQTGS